jgi:hypothetical protein
MQTSFARCLSFATLIWAASALADDKPVPAPVPGTSDKAIALPEPEDGKPRRRVTMKVTMLELPEAKRKAFETLLTPPEKEPNKKHQDTSPFVVVDDNGLCDKLIERLVKHDRVSILARPQLMTYTGIPASIEMLAETEPGRNAEAASELKSGWRLEVTPVDLDTGKTALRILLECKSNDPAAKVPTRFRQMFAVAVEADQTIIVLRRGTDEMGLLATIALQTGEPPERLVAPAPPPRKPAAKEPITARPMRRQNPDSNANAQDGFLHWSWRGNKPPAMLIPTSPNSAKVLPLSDSR